MIYQGPIGPILSFIYEYIYKYIDKLHRQRQDVWVNQKKRDVIDDQK